MATFSRSQARAIIMGAVVAGVVPAMQPILLGGMAEDLRITVLQIGQIAMLEALGMGLSTFLAGLFLTPQYLRHIAGVSAVGAAISNFGSVYFSPDWILLMRFTSGICSGLLMWILIGLAARVDVPARLSATYITVQATASFLFATVYAIWIGPQLGYAGAYYALAIFNLMLLAAIPFFPARFDLLKSAQTGGKASRLPSLSGWCALLAVGCHLAGIMALWVYLKPVAAVHGIADGTVATAISLALAAQIAGGFAAIFGATWVPYRRALLASLLLSIVTVLVSTTNSVVILAAIAIFGFLWMFAPPFHLPFLVDADSRGKAIMLVGTAQLAGVAIGPAVSALIISEVGVEGAKVASVAFFGLAITTGFLSLAGAMRANKVQPKFRCEL